jgi:hypothetical protein
MREQGTTAGRTECRELINKLPIINLVNLEIL